MVSAGQPQVEKVGKSKKKKAKKKSKRANETPEERAARKERKRLKLAKRKKDGDTKVKKFKKEKKRRRNQEPGDKKAKRMRTQPAAGTDVQAATAYRAANEISSTDGAKLPVPFMEFKDTPFSPDVLAAFKDAGFKAPSPIQAQGWPVVLSGRDLVAVAKTGSGKTLGFLLPIFHLIGQGAVDASGLVALVLTPTRELAKQIQVECDKFKGAIPGVGITSTCVYGGVPIRPQMEALKKMPNIVIACPGRMNDMLQRKACSLSGTKYLIMDEADRMLDMGFEPQIKTIAAQTSSSRQTLLFSATWPKSVVKMAGNYLRSGDDLVHISIGQGGEELAANKSVVQEFHELDDSEKDEKLWRIVSALSEDSKMIVFANTKRRIDHLANQYWKDGFGASAIHGGKSQSEREEALKNFVDGKWPLMFATDVAARGLDIKGVTHVLNFDMPRDVENYIHRIGRTGRAGKKGASITFWNKAYDIPCSPALAKIAREAEQVVPDWLTGWAKKAARQKKNKAWKY